jgi:HSP20 family protein
MDQTLQINVYRGPRRLMVATTIPGLEPQNIHIAVDGRQLSVQGRLRGLGQEKRGGYFQREWSVGPYNRTVDLPLAVDATRANASYDNGVLVMIFPLAAQPISGTMSLSKVGTSKGQCVRHVGQDLRPRASP